MLTVHGDAKHIIMTSMTFNALNILHNIHCDQIKATTTLITYYTPAEWAQTKKMILVKMKSAIFAQCRVSFKV